MNTAAYFVAGTDTGVGKTRVTAGLLAVGRADGLNVAGMKPVAAGAERRDGHYFSEDARLIAASSGQSTPYDLLNPYCLSDPVSPHVAAKRANIALDIGLIVANARKIAADRALFLVEGAGGWYAPISDHESMADVARALGFPVLLVVGLKLGCLNHARLTREAIEHCGCRFAGWIGSAIDPEFEAREENLTTLNQLLGAAPLAILPHASDASNDGPPLRPALLKLLA
jgi:dethiobiotin synthetase